MQLAWDHSLQESSAQNIHICIVHQRDIQDEAIAYYIEKLERIFDEATPANEVAAILVEPLQGEGGFIPAPIEWVKAVRKICDEHGILLIADEVQCGNCRTGKCFASEYWAEAGAALTLCLPPNQWDPGHQSVQSQQGKKSWTA